MKKMSFYLLAVSIILTFSIIACGKTSEVEDPSTDSTIEMDDKDVSSESEETSEETSQKTDSESSGSSAVNTEKDNSESGTTTGTTSIKQTATIDETTAIRPTTTSTEASIEPTTTGQVAAVTTTARQTAASTETTTANQITTTSQPISSTEVTTSHQHTWTAVYKTIHHDSEKVWGYIEEEKTENHTVCWTCGFDFTTHGGTEANQWHYKPGTSELCPGSGWGNKDVVIGTETVYDIIDVIPAYDEQVIDHYECSCGATKN